MFKTSLLPLARLRTLLGFFEGPGLMDGGLVGISSGVEGVISSRVIGVIIGVRRVFLILILVLTILLWGGNLSRGIIFI